MGYKLFFLRLDNLGIQCSPPNCDLPCTINYEAKPCPACECGESKHGLFH